MEQNKNPELTLVVSLEEANAILTALQELPAKIANPLSQKITEQARKQLEPTKTEADPVE